MFSDALHARTLSGFPLSVGTSLAFESCFEPVQPTIDPDRKIPSFIDLKDYEELWVNVGTLFRNVYNATDKTAIARILYADVCDCLVSEMDVISDLVNTYTFGKVNVNFYYSDYSDLTTRFKLGNLRLPRTANQFLYSKLYNDTLTFMASKSKTHKIRDISLYKSKFNGENKKAIILTHFPIDLLNSAKFKILDLLESHTGILKKEPSWHTKYYSGRDLNMLPLNGILLSVFGDDHHFHPQPKAMKEAILELAIEQKWNCLSSPREIVNGIKKLKDHALRDALLLQEQF